LLESEPYKQVKRIWKLLETRYGWVGVKAFSHPHLSFQGAQTGDLRKVGQALGNVLPEILPIEIQVDGIAHFGRNVIYLSVQKTDQLVKANRIINDLLHESCDGLWEHYAADRWTPHVTLAVDDLMEKHFDQAWDELSGQTIQFRQELHNLCTIGSFQNGKFRITRKYQCDNVEKSLADASADRPGVRNGLQNTVLRS
jgi:2'-5' RNA ligase